MKSGAGKKLTAAIVEYFRKAGGQTSFTANGKYQEFGCSQPGLSYSLKRLLEAKVMTIISGQIMGPVPLVMKLADEYMTGDSWRIVLKNNKHAITTQPHTEQLNTESTLAVLDQQIRVLQQNRRSVINLLDQKRRIEGEITDLRKQSGLKLNELRQIDQQIKEASSVNGNGKPAKQSLKNNSTDSDSPEAISQKTEVVEMVTFDAHMADYDQACARGAKVLPVSREGYVGTPTDLVR